MLWGCAGARFRAPEVSMPVNYINDSTASKTNRIINIDWWRNFNDQYLDTLMQMALEKNKNLVTAALKVEIAQMNLRNARAGLAPVFGLSIEGTADKVPSVDLVQEYSIQPTISWEIDIFGKLRYEAKATKAEMMAQEQNYRGVMLSLAASVAETYFTALQYDLSLKIAEKTLQSRIESAKLIGFLFEYGETTEIVIQQTNGLIYSAQNAVAKYKMAKQKTIMSLCELLSCNPTKLNIDGGKLLGKYNPNTIPVGIPAELLERRPDVIEAYYEVQKAYAEVGVAIANRFPTLTITGEGGLMSSTIGALFKGKPFGWSAAVELTQPILSFGTKKRDLRIAKLERQEAILQYEQTVVEALVEVEKVLIEVNEYQEQLTAQRKNAESWAVALGLTQELYLVGQGKYLDVLDSQREYFASQLSYVELLGEQMVAYIGLYKALGGGW